jgi:hypothetical protein
MQPSSTESEEFNTCCVCLNSICYLEELNKSNSLSQEASAIRDCVTCPRCRKVVCSECALYWQLTQNICPYCRLSPWNVTIINQSAKRNGFIWCPGCSRIGCLKCHNSSCRVTLSFKENLSVVSSALDCPFCESKQSTIFMEAEPHECSTGGRKESHRNICMFKCNVCEAASCGCCFTIYS